MSRPFGLVLLFGSAMEIITISMTKIRKHQPVLLRKGIGVSGMYLKAMAKGMANAAAVMAASEVVRFQNIPRKNKANAPGVR